MPNDLINWTEGRIIFENKTFQLQFTKSFRYNTYWLKVLFLSPYIYIYIVEIYIYMSNIYLTNIYLSKIKSNNFSFYAD